MEMKKSMKLKKICGAVLIAGAVALAGCSTTTTKLNKTEAGVVAGAGAGAWAGGLTSALIATPAASFIGAPVGALVGAGIGGVIGHFLPAQELVIMAPEDVTFAFDKATIRKQFYPTLNHVADFMKQNPNIRVAIAGHTDSIGSVPYNMKLSQERAKAIATYLIEAGVPKNRVHIDYFGESRPVASNSNSSGRAKNRHVTMTLSEVTLAPRSTITRQP